MTDEKEMFGNPAENKFQPGLLTLAAVLHGCEDLQKIYEIQSRKIEETEGHPHCIERNG